MNKTAKKVIIILAGTLIGTLIVKLFSLPQFRPNRYVEVYDRRY